MPLPVSAGLQALEPRQLFSVSAIMPILDRVAYQDGPTLKFDLDDHFTDNAIDGTVVKFNSVLGDVYVELADQDAPITVANFLNYVNSKAYNDSFVHRSVDDFVVQGGGFTYTNQYGEVEADDPIVNEAIASGLSNTRGTIAMARTNDPDSATSQWFFNVQDNTSDGDNDLDPGGITADGYAVFGEVLGDGMDIIDAINALDTFGFNAPFGELPLRDYTNTDFNNDVTPDGDNLVLFNRVQTVGEVLYEVTGVSNPSKLAASVNNQGVLKLNPKAGQSGTVTVSVKATSFDGNSITRNFDVIIDDAQPSTDVNGDGKPDLIYRNMNNGANTAWLLNGRNVTGSASLRNWGNTDNVLVGTADFNDDGSPDLVFHNVNTGKIKVWYFDGDNYLGNDTLATQSNTDWIVGGVGDFDGDGDGDLILRNLDSGGGSFWEFEGDQRVNFTGINFRRAKPQWVPVGAGDFDNDGTDDLVWRNQDNGKNIVTKINNGDTNGVNSIRDLPDANWQLGAVGDFDKDGHVDIVWRRSDTGKNRIDTYVGFDFTTTLKLNDRNPDFVLPGFAGYVANDAIPAAFRFALASYVLDEDVASE